MRSISRALDGRMPTVGPLGAGASAEEVWEHLHAIGSGDIDWRSGRIARFGYHANESVSDLSALVYGAFGGHNAMAVSAFPSIGKLEDDVVAASLKFLGGAENGCGWATSGGSESILLALKAARDDAIARGNVHRRDVLLGQSAHPAFDKAAHLLGLRVLRVGLDCEYRTDVDALSSLISDSTLLLVGSAPSWPFGIIDPIAEMGKLALEADVRMHVDACVGGFFLPFMPESSMDDTFPAWNLSTPGVSSLSADMHKYGYAPKGASVILYNDRSYAEHQTFHLPLGTWPGGSYSTPTISGTRSGGPIAAAWATMTHLGEAGYREIVKSVMNISRSFQSSIEEIPEVALCGAPIMSIIAYRSAVPELDILAVADELEKMGWYCGRQVAPRSIQMAFTLPHERVRGEYLGDLTNAIGRALETGARSSNGAHYT